MSVNLTGHEEARRIYETAQKREKPRWGLYSGTSLADVLHRAKDMGWFEGKVQVRTEGTASDVTTFIIEPHETDCNCPSILKYADYFDPPRHG